MTKFKTASLLSLLYKTPAQEIELAEGIKAICCNKQSEIDFFNYCNTWKLAPWANIQLKRNGLINLFSHETANLLEESYKKVKRENEQRNNEAVRFLSEFRKHNIDVAILKGNLFANIVYGDTGYKRMNDFDILIHSKDWDKIQTIYISLGYIPLGFGWSGEKEKAAKFSHVGMSYISADFSCIIGSQWGLKSPGAGFTVNIDSVWQTMNEFNFCNIPVKKLSVEYNLLHLVLHMGIFKCGIRDCMDVYNLCMYEKPDTEKLINIIKESNAVDKAFFTFSISNVCSQNLNDIIAKLKPRTNSFLIKRLTKRIAVHNSTGDFQNSYNDYFQDIEKAVIYFNLFPAFHKKLYFYFIILKLIFIPNIEMALKLNDSGHLKNSWQKIVARLKSPYFVFALIAQEIGWKFTVVLFVKLFVDVFVSLKHYFFKKQSYFDYLKNRGVDPKAIEKAVKNIQ